LNWKKNLLHDDLEDFHGSKHCSVKIHDFPLVYFEKIITLIKKYKKINKPERNEEVL
jgi:hypothetical protein